MTLYGALKDAKPCPECKGLHLYMHDHCIYSQVRCTCGFRGPDDSCSHDGAVRQWNALPRKEAK